MLPVEDPAGPAERGIRPIEASADPAENLRRLRESMSRGEGYLGFVVPGPVLVAQSDLLARPLMKEIAERGLSLIEIDLIPQATGTLVRMTHSGLPENLVAAHAKGWAHFYARLAIVAAGGDPGPDPWLKEKEAAGVDGRC